MENLNTMNSFNKGFNIVRNGKIITLTPEEMSDFRYLEQAVRGRECLDCYKDWANEDDVSTIEEMMNDEEICYNIEEDVLDIVMTDGDVGMIEQDVICDYIMKNRI